MDGCVKEGRLKAAWSMLDEMRQAGQKPDAVTFTNRARLASEALVLYLLFEHGQRAGPAHLWRCQWYVQYHA